MAGGCARPARALAARDPAREPQLGHRRDRLHWRAAPFRLPRRAPGRCLRSQVARAGAPPASRSRGREIEDLPLFPLNTVLFPGGRLPLRVSEQRYMGMAKTCLKDGTPFGVCLIREGSEVGKPAVPAGVGTLARITDWDMPQLGLLQVVARGEGRFRILERRVERDGLARARVA